jgi:diguanylate cyclase (GGDEF)-like protein
VGTAVAEQTALTLANLRLRSARREQAIRDPLTSLFNRRYLEETLERELQHAIRRNRPLSLMMLDLDHFKRFNDEFGHDVGDLVLRSIGEFLRAHTRAEDIVCRYGGEEFLIVMLEAPSKWHIRVRNRSGKDSSSLGSQTGDEILGSDDLYWASLHLAGTVGRCYADPGGRCRLVPC